VFRELPSNVVIKSFTVTVLHFLLRLESLFVSDQFIRSATLMLVLLNPFFMSIYLLDLIQDMPWPKFVRAVFQGTLISCAVFVGIAFLGDVFFSDVLQVRFSSFLIFGGSVFLIVSIRSFFLGPDSLRTLRGTTEAAGGSIAIPFMIGPGTLSASVSAGAVLTPVELVPAIIIPVFLSMTAVTGFKKIHDLIENREDDYESSLRRYIDVTGRIMSLITGTIAVEMLLRGVEQWLHL
jgi:multiple antibiotic resistance protein